MRESRESGPVVDYQLNLLSADERVQRRLEFECRDDAHAVSVVAEHASQQAMELWQGERLVRRFEAQD